ncbi:hypothetical protein TRIATDRAFT_255814 [Trichoderma atroviride IMI 206040]|uniref:Uncharacterized protein n=1 Tax=Hypocrea atroviridis (strain ATCC 20476 / IMI 206040) TaxID=452589 RepID=G9NN69_HYPAI|nr:uncharacterized protein TRIATDRAFT_255814 [Trichoderma atroviride IMI 206040]EHK48343.1 hypothetical protein TRIATDRAFT_255814 [Trichoderma atroviride IMI 206040]
MPISSAWQSVWSHRRLATSSTPGPGLRYVAREAGYREYLALCIAQSESQPEH